MSDDYVYKTWEAFRAWHTKRYGWTLRDDRGAITGEVLDRMRDWRSWEEATRLANEEIKKQADEIERLTKEIEELNKDYGPFHGHDQQK